MSARRFKASGRKAPEPEQEPHLFQLLTQTDFRLVFSVAFLSVTDVFEGAYPIDRYPTPGSTTDAMDWEEAFKRTIRFLAFDHEFHFERELGVFTDGRIVGEIVAPDNDLYIATLRMGSLPDVRRAFSEALREFPTRAPGLDLNPLREAQAKVAMDLAETRAEAEPAEVIAEEAVRAQVLRELARRN